MLSGLFNVVINSSTTVKVRGGKNVRVKIPACRALKKLNNTEGIGFVACYYRF